MNNVLNLLGRIGLSAIFISAGWSKLLAYEGTRQYMEASGVSGTLLPLVILAELGGGLALLIGLWTRWAALGLAAFSVAAALLFHGQAGDANQSIHFWKNIAMAGGLLLAAQGAGSLSLDGWWAGRRRVGA